MAESHVIRRFDDWGKKRDEGQMSESRRQKSGSERTAGIDLLAERVAEVVKIEVLRFFQGEEG